tara:strand:+ start:1687 stop:1824 length:138 start_codon:yes stop_codon:yes gene_type:complete
MILDQQEVMLAGKRYIVYLKEVASSLDKKGKPATTYFKAFIRKLD